jgi:transcriptional regulator with XRE-family HTH domain
MDAGKTGKLIQTIRTELGMRQEDLAAQLHVSRSTISKYERGIGCPDISLLEPLAKALHITVTELMRGEREKTDPVHEEILRETIQTGSRKYLRQNLFSLFLTAGMIFGIILWRRLYGNWMAAEVLVPIFCLYTSYQVWKDNHRNWLVWMIVAGGLLLSFLIEQSWQAEQAELRRMSSWNAKSFHINSDRSISGYGFTVDDGLSVYFFENILTPDGLHNEYEIRDYSHMLSEYGIITGTFSRIGAAEIQLNCPVLGNPIAIRQTDGLKLIYEQDEVIRTIDLLNMDPPVYAEVTGMKREPLEYRDYVPQNILYGIVRGKSEDEILVEECNEHGKDLTGRMIRVPLIINVKVDDPPEGISYPAEGVRLGIAYTECSLGEFVSVRYDKLSSDQVPQALGAYDIRLYGE